MVTGGGSGAGKNNLFTTELLRDGASGTWETISGGELQSSRRGLRAATLNNKIIVTGRVEKNE